MKNDKFIQFRQDLGYLTQLSASIGFGIHLQTLKALDHGASPTLDTIIKLQKTHNQIKGYDVDIISIFKN